LTEHDLKVEHPQKPLAVRRDWYRYSDDGTFRAVGKKVSTEYGTGPDVQVRVWVTDHHRPVKVNKAYLIAIAVHGWPDYWECPDCGERIHDVVEHRNGHRYDTSPGNVKAVPDVSGRVWHRLQCLENMMGRAYESEEGCPNDGPRHRDANSFMVSAAMLSSDDEDERGNTALPRMFHSVTIDEDKELNDPAKVPTDNDPLTRY
jgi:hypothetical protein